MGAITGIGWTDHSFNGWIGCSEAGPGCVLCYARDLDARYQWGVKKEDRRTDGLAPHWGPGAPRYRTSAGNWKGPILWNKQAQARGVPAKVFCNSLSDVFDNEVEQQWREDLFALWRETPWLRWQVLTKRVPNIRRMLPFDWGTGYRNVGLVATIVNQAEWDRDAMRLLGIPAAWHGFSLEPQLELIFPFGLLKRAIGGGSVWIITGGESAQKGADGKTIEPRPYNLRWARSLLAESRINFSKVFVKQTGAKPIGCEAPTDGSGSNPDLWPADIRVQQFPDELLR